MNSGRLAKTFTHSMNIAYPAPSVGVHDIFASLDTSGKRHVSSTFIVDFLRDNGLHRGDTRLEGFFSTLDDIADNQVAIELNEVAFDRCAHSCLSLIRKCVSGNLIIPSFPNFTKHIDRMYEEAAPNKEGTVASYIPELSCVNPELFGISVTTIDGQQYSLGDADVEFCVQSCGKPISYLMALEQWGSAIVHEHVGTEPSGLPFNSMALKDSPSEKYPKRQIPHNPMINAGAIVSASFLYPRLTQAERLQRVLQVWQDASMNTTSSIGFSQETYESESRTADRNWCLGYMMKERHSFREEVFNYKIHDDLRDTLELYFRTCSITASTRAMSVLAATLANGGINPFTSAQVFCARNVMQVLPLMFSCGMYDYSGQWAFDVGIPAKSGVSGSVFAVVPNVCGIAIFSPRLDSVGNSVRAVSVMKKLVETFTFHNFEVFKGYGLTKIRPTVLKNQDVNATMASIMFAAMEGDCQAMHAFCHDGTPIFAQDYDGRTALHLAATEHHIDMTKILLEEMCRRYETREERRSILNLRDRWNATAYFDASECQDIKRLLSEHTGIEEAELAEANSDVQRPLTRRCSSPWLSSPRFSSPRSPNLEKLSQSSDAILSPIANCPKGAPNELSVASIDAPQIIFAAADGDIDELVKCRCSGLNLYMRDYDYRSALHLAASNGHLPVIQYLLAQVPRSEWPIILETRDRWGNTALADAQREGHPKCALLLSTAASKHIVTNRERKGSI